MEVRERKGSGGERRLAEEGDGGALGGVILSVSRANVEALGGAGRSSMAAPAVSRGEARVRGRRGGVRVGSVHRVGVFML